MIDYAKITARAGDGGSGAGSFEHIKGKRRGKPDGGDGGRGGNVYIEATNDLNTLEPFRYLKEYKAENGGNGLSKKCKGAEGRDYIVRVPVGTQVKVNSEKGEMNSQERNRRLSTDHSALITDLVQEGDKILIARGGEGGRGNCHLKDEYGRRPFKGETGESGEVCDLILEMKLIAQVGLIGLPNAGKSTLLSQLTAARPKIADYPFTTLEPNLGVMNGSWFMVHGSSRGRRGEDEASMNNELRTMNKPASLVIADIPGLIEGASQGRGLGDLFLRHIERTKVLVHLIDASGGSDAFKNYQVVHKELADYSKELAKKREIIAVNKIDLVDAKVIDQIKIAFAAKRKKIYLISAQTGEGVDGLVKAVSKKL